MPVGALNSPSGFQVRLRVLNPMVSGVGDVDVAVRVRRQADRLNELTRPDSGSAPLGETPALRVELDDPLVPRVRDVNRSPRDQHRPRAEEPDLLAADRGEEPVVGSHVDDPLIPGVGDPQVALRVDGQAARLIELSRTWTLRPKLA